MRKLALPLIAATLMLSACAKQGSITMLPSEDGETPGTVKVLTASTGKEKAVIDTPGTTTTTSGKITSETSEVAASRYKDLFDSLPPAPRSFTLYFIENSVNLTPESQKLLPEIFAELAKRPGADLEITGHTDTMGKLEVNDALSLRRAAEVTSIFFAEGLDKAVIRIAGRGERDLKEQTPDETSSAVNRRVEVLVR
jgi:outer membrane protein OmpA-like peptidoglycan-associated protein